MAVAMEQRIPVARGAHPYTPVRRDPAFTFVLPRPEGAPWEMGWEGHSDHPQAVQGEIEAQAGEVRVQRRWTMNWWGVPTIINGGSAVGLERATAADLRELAAWLTDLAGEMGLAETREANWWVTWGYWSVEFVGWTVGMVTALRDSLENMLADEGQLERSVEQWPQSPSGA